MIETELSFGQTTFLLWVPPFLSYELRKQRIELSKNSIQTCSKALFGWRKHYHSPLKFRNSNSLSITHISISIFSLTQIKTCFVFYFVFYNSKFCTKWWDPFTMLSQNGPFSILFFFSGLFHLMPLFHFGTVTRSRNSKP